MTAKEIKAARRQLVAVARSMGWPASVAGRAAAAVLKRSGAIPDTPNRRRIVGTQTNVERKS